MKSERSWITRLALDTFEQPQIKRAIARDVSPYFAQYPLDYSGSYPSRNERRQRDPLYGGDLWTSTLPDGVTLGRDRDGIRLLRNIGQTPDGTDVTVYRRVIGSWLHSNYRELAVEAGSVQVGAYGGDQRRFKFSAHRFQAKGPAWKGDLFRWSDLTIAERQTMRRALKVVKANRPHR